MCSANELRTLPVVSETLLVADHSVRPLKPINPTNYAPSLANFQRRFGQYLRQPHNQDANASVQSPTLSLAEAAPGASSRVAKLYQSLVFNNIRSFLDQCFPVCQSLIDDEQWLDVCQQFFAQQSCHSPYFTEINQSFVDFLAQPNQLSQLGLPAYFAELAHYEWVELLVDTHTDQPLDDSYENSSEADLKSRSDSAVKPQTPANSLKLLLNPSLQNLHYEWPVHSISDDEQPQSPEDSFFLVFRNAEDKVEFMQVNALTHALLDHINSQAPISTTPETLTQTLSDLLSTFSQALGYDDSNVLVEFGLPLLKQLIQQDVLQGIHQTKS
ncbi:DNA-binding domain-containing protein [Psychrobacter pygoscelis]|uniref:HvfC family RiPP maturation protein n=1 Tax=Psychrobacter pygoscelis TaxID=2488563 RepID=UPI0013F40B6B|nr:putative DNA-binding domain-containing protein [Psychrobacter pygoscelis]